MARKVTPNPTADVAAYIVDGHDSSGEVVTFGGGQHVRIVDDPAQAQLRIRLKGKSAWEARNIALSGRRPAVGSRSGGWFGRYVGLAGLLWIGLIIAFLASDQGTIGQFFILLLLTPVVAPLWALFLRVIRTFM